MRFPSLRGKRDIPEVAAADLKGDIAQLQEQLAEAKLNGKATRRNAIVVASIGAAALFGPAIINALTADPAPIACIDERSKAVSFVKDNPGVWIPLKPDDPFQQKCDINGTVARLPHP